jgi:hypothetical protein
MSHEVTSRYRVEDVVQSQGDVWLEDLHPQRSGFLVAVEVDGQYDPDLQDKVDNLTEGETVIATLKSQDQRHTVWHFSDINEEPRKQTGQAVAQS